MKQEKRGRDHIILLVGVVIPLHTRTHVTEEKMSAVQVMAQSAVGGAADRTPFFGIKVPQELRKTIQLAKNLDTALFKNIVKCELLIT